MLRTLPHAEKHLVAIDEEGWGYEATVTLVSPPPSLYSKQKALKKCREIRAVDMENDKNAKLPPDKITLIRKEFDSHCGDVTVEKLSLDKCKTEIILLSVPPSPGSLDEKKVAVYKEVLEHDIKLLPNHGQLDEAHFKLVENGEVKADLGKNLIKPRAPKDKQELFGVEKAIKEFDECIKMDTHSNVIEDGGELVGNLMEQPAPIDELRAGCMRPAADLQSGCKSSTLAKLQHLEADISTFSSNLLGLESDEAVPTNYKQISMDLKLEVPAVSVKPREGIGVYRASVSTHTPSKFFEGAMLAANNVEFPDFDELLEHLAHLTYNQETSPNGIRHISLPFNGDNYVYSSYSAFEKFHYGSVVMRRGAFRCRRFLKSSVGVGAGSSLDLIQRRFSVRLVPNYVEAAAGACTVVELRRSQRK